MECLHDRHRSPFQVTLSARKGMAQAVQRDIALECCTKCGVLRIDPADADRMLRT